MSLTRYQLSHGYLLTTPIPEATMMTVRDILTRVTALPDVMGVWKPGLFLSELRVLAKDSTDHIKAANAADALTIHLDKVPAV